MEAGLKSTLSRDERIQRFEQFNQQTNQFEVNELITDGFEFNENVYAGYFIYRNKINKIGYQAGLRAEQTFTAGTQENTGITIHNDYFNLFPSLYLSYEVKDDEEFSLNYSRRIRRPGTWALSPMINAQDLINLRTGNPYLQPEFTDSYEAGYLKGWEKYLFTGTIYHRRSTDIMTRFVTVDENNVALQSWANANRRISTGLEVINQFQFSDKVDATLTGNFFHSEIFGENIREDFRNSNFSWTINLLSNIRIPNFASIQLQGNYRGPIVLPQGQIDPMYGLNVGIKRDLWDKTATISVNVSDIFNTRIFRIKNEDPFFTQERMFNRETRIGTITFTYRFKGFQERRGRQGEREDTDDDPF
jgi:outer membrane receptor protein involved in Fe transport